MVATQVVGVLPHGADFGIDQMYDLAAYHPPYTPDGTVDIWVPARATEQQFPRQTHPFVALARFAPGASVAARCRPRS